MARNEQNDQGKMSREEAGRKGGEKISEERGPEFYSEIGSQGAEASSSRFDREGDPSAAGRKGGRSTGNSQDD